MMIRLRQGTHTSTVLLIRVSWSPDRKRSVQKVLGSFPASASSLPEELAGPESPLTSSEKTEARAWISMYQARQQASALPSLGGEITRNAMELADAINSPIWSKAALSELDHLALYNAMDHLARTLRRHCLPRSPRRKAKTESSSVTDDAGYLTSAKPEVTLDL